MTAKEVTVGFMTCRGTGKCECATKRETLTCGDVCCRYCSFAGGVPGVCVLCGGAGCRHVFEPPQRMPAEEHVSLPFRTPA